MRSRKAETEKTEQEEDFMLYCDARLPQSAGPYAEASEALEKWIRNGCAPGSGFRFTGGGTEYSVYVSWRCADFCRIEISETGITGIPEPAVRSAFERGVILWSPVREKDYVLLDGGKAFGKSESRLKGRIYGTRGVTGLIAGSDFLRERFCLPEISLRKCAERALTPDRCAAAELIPEFLDGKITAGAVLDGIFREIRNAGQAKNSRGRDSEFPDRKKVRDLAGTLFAQGYTAETAEEYLKKQTRACIADAALDFSEGVPTAASSAEFMNPAKTAETLLIGETGYCINQYTLNEIAGDAYLETAVPEEIRLLQSAAYGTADPETVGISVRFASDLAAAHRISRAVLGVQRAGAKTISAVLKTEGKPERKFRLGADIKAVTVTGTHSGNRIVFSVPRDCVSRAEADAPEDGGYCIFGGIPADAFAGIVYRGKNILAAAG